MKATNGKRPRSGERELRVKYRNGMVDDRPRTARQMRWDNSGSDWDIVEVEYWSIKK